MRILITIIIILVLSAFQVLNAQKGKDTYNTKIDKTQNVEINNENGVVTIKKADTVIIKVYMSENNSPVFVDSFSQKKDTSGVYTTTIRFTSNKLLTFDFELLFFFDKPIDRMSLEVVGHGGLQTSQALSPDRKIWEFSGKSFTKYIQATIISKEMVEISIKGTEGFLKR